MEKGDRLHIVVLPWLGFSHLNPFFELSNRIAQLGHCISFVSTKPVIERLALVHSIRSPLIHLVPLPGEDIDSLEGPLMGFLEWASPAPDWILIDFASYWATRIAAGLGIRCALVNLIGAAPNAFMWPTMCMRSRPQPERLTGPPRWVPFATPLAYRTHEARQVLSQLFDVDDSGLTLGYRVWSSITESDLVAMRSCTELEPEWFDLLPQLYNKPVLALGHFPPNDSAAVGGLTKNWEEAFAWLDKQEVGSVVYVALGSELYLSRQQLHELANGLELAQLPFIWALRITEEDKTDGLPDGFQNRTQGRGIVLQDWAPQVRVLAHPSVGGFLTHCGWNSLVEALQFGLSLVLLPLAYDQGLYARLLVHKGIGAEVPRNDDDGIFTAADVAKTLRLVMVDSEGKALRDKAKEMKGVLGSQELHDQYVRKFVEYLKANRHPKMKLRE
ncbi:putative UDP-rhamnose:rhamnosyltransferase 1 [Typha latifolia]|uniref:putative UDP-rhamnose:rhamnosyltransferase 1 n=1 Tax=Typha latifolia TaxID=4733 RepID=UPI003C2D17B2